MGEEGGGGGGGEGESDVEGWPELLNALPQDLEDSARSMRGILTLKPHFVAPSDSR